MNVLNYDPEVGLAFLCDRLRERGVDPDAPFSSDVNRKCTLVIPIARMATGDNESGRVEILTVSSDIAATDPRCRDWSIRTVARRTLRTPGIVKKDVESRLVCDPSALGLLKAVKEKYTNTYTWASNPSIYGMKTAKELYGTACKINVVNFSSGDVLLNPVATGFFKALRIYKRLQYIRQEKSTVYSEVQKALASDECGTVVRFQIPLDSYKVQSHEVHHLRKVRRVTDKRLECPELMQKMDISAQHIVEIHERRLAARALILEKPT
jgi:hypothetical protein